MPGVSVLMPVRNGGEYLQAAADSILQQHDVELELIVIDDHSEDGAIQRLNADARIKLIQSTQRGIVPALNHGFEHAQYDFIARMDDDDMSLPKRLRTQLDFLLANPAIDIAGTKVEIFKDHSPIDQGYQLYQHWINSLTTPEDIAKNFFIESCIPHPSVMMHRDVFKALGGYHDTSWPEDYDLWCRAHTNGYKFGKPDEVLLRWRDYDKRTSRVDDRYSKQEFLRCKAKYLSEQLKQQGVNKCVIWGAGPNGLKLHDYLETNGISVSGFADINPKLKDREKRGKPVQIISNNPGKDKLTSLGGFCVVSVGSRGARDRIREALLGADLVELKDFILAT